MHPMQHMPGVGELWFCLFSSSKWLNYAKYVYFFYMLLLFSAYRHSHCRNVLQIEWRTGAIEMPSLPTTDCHRDNIRQRPARLGHLRRSRLFWVRKPYLPSYRIDCRQNFCTSICLNSSLTAKATHILRISFAVQWKMHSVHTEKHWQSFCCVLQDLALLFDSVRCGRLQGRRASLSSVQDHTLYT